MTSPSESTELEPHERYDYERLKALEVRGLDAYQKMQKAEVGSPDRIVAYINQLSPWNLERGAETLKSFLAQEYSRGVSDALTALPEENKLPDADPEYAPGVMVAWSQGRRQALAEARQNIEKLKEPSNEQAN